MLKKLIIIENGKEVQCDTLEDLVKILIDENYYNMTEKEKIEKMTMKALANTLNNKMEVTQDISKIDNIEEKFIIKDEITYILSLVKTNNVLLLERRDSNILTGSLNKEYLKDNYIIVNTFAKELLRKYIAK